MSESAKKRPAGKEPPDGRLDPRAEEVLQIVIHHYVLSNRPVGSRTVAKASRERLSAATIRNIMADLADSGYLSQPHTSAGRQPTETGFRYYVDTLRKRALLPRSEKSLVQAALQEAGRDRDALMGEASRLLSRLSRQIGVVSAPDPYLGTIQQIEFRSLGAERVLVIFVDASGQPQSRVVASSRDYTQSQLDRMGAELAAGFLSLAPEERKLLLAREGGLLPAHRFGPASGPEALDLLRQFLERLAADSPVFVEATDDVIDQPEFSDVANMRALFRALQKRHQLGEILHRYRVGEGIQVHIGSENLSPDLSPFTLVTSTYGLGERPLGTLGILGPIRMQYDRAIAVVDYVSKVFSHLLTEHIH